MSPRALFDAMFRTTSPGWRLAVVVLVVAAIASLAACQGRPAGSATLYQCPMHPSYVSDRPGDCPICGMRLVPVEKGSGSRPATEQAKPAVATAVDATDRQPVVYTCPMHPEIRQSKPGECPLCGMDLVPVSGSRAAFASDARPQSGHEGHSAMGPAAAPPGAGTVFDIGADQARLAGVRTVAAMPGQISHQVRAVGTVAVDETGIREITTKVPGFVEKLYVNAVGQDVSAGQPLFEIYSPELLASQEEYLRARQTAATFERSSLPEVQRGGQDLAKAARQRLELFDVPPEFLDHLEQTGKPERRIVFKAPFSGVVTAKNVLEGQRIDTGMSLLTVTDLSHVWVLAQVYEAEASAARTGRQAVVTLPYDAGVKLAGRVSFVYPTLDADTRTLKVRLAFRNPRMALKPGMFVNVELSTEEARGLIVPDSAIIDSGTRHVVFVETGTGQFAPREVQVAMRADGQAAIRAGLVAGERVAVAASFLLDSESRLRNAVGLAAAGKDK